MPMSVPVTYDLTRLILRSFARNPNGIDRVDINLARHFSSSGSQQKFGVVLSRFRPLVVGSRTSAALIDAVNEGWRETQAAANNVTLDAVRRRLTLPADSAYSPDARPRRIVRARQWPALAVVRLAALTLQLATFRAIPRDSVFIHATQFPNAELFGWLDYRPDVKPVFFIHDLLPMSHPEVFTTRNADEFRKFLDIFLRYGRAAIVNTEFVKSEVIAFLRTRGCLDKKIFVAPMPAAPVFARSMPPDNELRAQPYFVICGTIEPRKNHLLLLDVWQELVRKDAAAAPKLVIIGNRGWKNEDVFDRLDRASFVASHVTEVAGLSSSGVRHLIANARALLMPSIAEGYGLPIVEALAAGTPVIASDIAAFREIGEGRITYCRCNDIGQWANAINSHTEWRPAIMNASDADNELAWKRYYRDSEQFIAGL